MRQRVNDEAEAFVQAHEDINRAEKKAWKKKAILDKEIVVYVLCIMGLAKLMDI